MDDPRLPTIQALVMPIVAEQTMELVELTCRPQGRQLLVRLLVDRVGGVTLQQCAQLNRLVAQALEQANLIEGSYTIEVSSPGLDRPLVSQRDFERALGEDIQLHLMSDNGKSTELHGMLLAIQREAVVIKTSAGNMTVPKTQIQFAKKALRW